MDALSSGMHPVHEMKLGGALVDFTETLDASKRCATDNHDATLYAFVGDQVPSTNSEPLLKFRVGHAVNMPSSRHCNFAGDDCWTVRTHPKITSISASTGYTTGSQELRVSGYGLNGTDVSVVVDGVDCAVKSSNVDAIVCETGAAQAPSTTDVSQPG